MVEQETIKVKEVKIKRHPILAGFIDYCFLGYVLNAIVALGIGIRKESLSENSLFYFIITLIVIFLPIVYHWFYAKKTLFLSVGELCVGKKIIDGQKEWTNPKGKSRGFEFFFFAFTYGTLINMFMGVASGRIYPIYSIVFNASLYTLFVYQTTKIGQEFKKGKKNKTIKSRAL
jgi:hypothetical protein